MCLVQYKSKNTSFFGNPSLWMYCWEHKSQENCIRIILLSETRYMTTANITSYIAKILNVCREIHMSPIFARPKEQQRHLTEWSLNVFCILRPEKFETFNAYIIWILYHIFLWILLIICKVSLFYFYTLRPVCLNF